MVVPPPLAPMDEFEDEDNASQLSSRPALKRLSSVRKQPYYSNLRFQLQEQLKSLDGRVETQVALTSELQEFFRRRAEVELECSRSLDKLAKSLAFRQKELKAKRDQWHLFSVSNCWQQLISETKKQSKEHAVLADIYSTHVTTRLSYVADDLQRIYKQCKEVGIEAHEELLKVLHELHTSTKTFHAYQTECKQAEAKLKVVEAQKAKLELAIPKEKIERSKKIRLVDKEIQKRRNKYNDARFKALKAKNEYILCMDAANAAVQKYFVDDLSDLIDCMDLGFYQCISRALNMYLSSQDQMKRSLQTNMDNLNKCITSLDSRLDKQKFLEANNSAFIMPKKFEFQAPMLKGEEIDSSELGELEATGFIRQELEQRLLQLHRRLDTLRTESDELWKTLETAESSLLEMLIAKDYDAAQHFTDVTKILPKQPETITLKIRADRHETDEFHLSKFRDYMLGTNRIARLQAKYDHIRKVLNETDQGGSSPALAQTLAGGPQPTRKVRRKRIGQLQSSGNPRLFGGSLEEYLEATNQDIPIVMKSCIRVINLYGLHHQGIFRVSGSQVEINNFKDTFERGDDPLADVNDASDINSVGGVLKLYLRELREPLFPIVYFEQFMEMAQLESKQIFVSKMKDLVKSLPRPVFIVLRYLFAFLNHLSEFSDENMMDPYNLAICFGPTLVPVPEDKDQVQYQNLVNELIKNVIIYAEDIFPQDGGVIYEKYISKEPDEGDVGDAPTDQSQDELDSEICPSEDDSVFLKEKDISLQIFGKSEFLEAIAQFDFVARSKREVSFKKGDSVTLYSQVSGDWWKGSVNGIDGLVPDKYIMLKIRDEEKERMDSTGSAKEDFIHHRNRTASDSFLSTQPKQLSITLSPSLHGGDNRRQLYVKSSSPNLFLGVGVSGESLASSTSPESPSEFDNIEKEPQFSKTSTVGGSSGGIGSNGTGQTSTVTVITTTVTPVTGNVKQSSGSGQSHHHSHHGGHGHGHPHSLGHSSLGGTPTRSMSIAVPVNTSTPILSVPGNCHQIHQRSLSVTEDRHFLSQTPKWKEALMEEGNGNKGGDRFKSHQSEANNDQRKDIDKETTVTISVPVPDQHQIVGRVHSAEETQRERSPTPVGKKSRPILMKQSPERSSSITSNTTDSKEEETSSMSINMSFSTPKTVDNDDAPSAIDIQFGQGLYPNKSAHLLKSHGKNKSWDSPRHPDDPDHPSSDSPDQIRMDEYHRGSTTMNLTVGPKSIAHHKSKSEDLERGPPPTAGVEGVPIPIGVGSGAGDKEKPNFQSNIQFWELRSRYGPSGHHGHTPDLVMDLPVAVTGSGGGSGPGSTTSGDLHRSTGDISSLCSENNSSSPSSSTSGSPPESPESLIMTAAECFAKQNQCTLKKNQQCQSPAPPQQQCSSSHTRMESSSSSSTSGISTSPAPIHLPQEFASKLESVVASQQSQLQYHETICEGHPFQSQHSHHQQGHMSKGQISFFDSKDNIRIGIAKPQVKVKPQVLKKPSFPSTLIEKPERKSPTPPPHHPH